MHLITMNNVSIEVYCIYYIQIVMNVMRTTVIVHRYALILMGVLPAHVILVTNLVKIAKTVTVRQLVFIKLRNNVNEIERM